MNKKTRKLLLMVLLPTLALIIALVFFANRKNKPAESNIEQNIENEMVLDEMEVSYLDSLKEHFIRQIYLEAAGLEDSNIVESEYEKWKEDNKEYLEQIKVEMLDDE